MTATSLPSTEAASATGAPAVRRRRRSLVLDSGWTGRFVFVGLALVLFLIPNVVIDDPTRIRQWAEYLCYAMIAVGLDIAWGYGGMLALGQGVFFGIGAYCMGMYLSLEQVPKGSLPEFMSLYSDYKSLPWLWKPFQSFWFAAAAAVVLPMLVAGGLGLLVFKRRVRGPFFALLTQATALVFSLLLIGNLKLTAGFNGLTGFTKIFGRNKYDADTNRWLYEITAVGLLVVVALALWIVRSRYGKLLTATRDSEDRVRFLGYDPAMVKTVAFMIGAGHGRRGRGVRGAGDRHRGPQPVRRAPVDPHGLLGRRRRAGHGLGRRARRHPRELGPHAGQRVAPRQLDLLPGPAVHRGAGVRARRDHGAPAQRGRPGAGPGARDGCDEPGGAPSPTVEAAAQEVRA